MSRPRRGGRRPSVRGYAAELARKARLDRVAAVWRRIPDPVRGLAPLALVVCLAVTYPFYVQGLPTNIPVILTLPTVHDAVSILVFVIMAVGLNVVVGYAGLLDLGYVAFYAIGAYTAGWLASGQFEQVKVHFVLGGSRVSLIWLILLSLALGVLGGVLLSQFYRRRHRRH